MIEAMLGARTSRPHSVRSTLLFSRYCK